MSIHNFINKIKGWGREYRKSLISLGILAGFGVVAFYAGYAARAETAQEPLVHIACPANAYVDPLAFNELAQQGPPKQATSPVGGPQGASGAYVASKNGKKYYPVNCAGAKRIKAENRVYFGTEEAARSAGYEPAAGCT